jgi:hypothetical protein
LAGFPVDAAAAPRFSRLRDSGRAISKAVSFMLALWRSAPRADQLSTPKCRIVNELAMNMAAPAWTMVVPTAHFQIR